MIPYSNNLRFLKGYEFLLFAKNISQNIGKIQVKNQVVNTVKTWFITLNNLVDAFKTALKRVI